MFRRTIESLDHGVRATGARLIEVETTAEYGNAVAENPLTVHDLHATILHQLGLAHRKLTFRLGGRDISLTDVHGQVVRDLLA